jgi:hypothetical protein
MKKIKKVCAIVFIVLEVPYSSGIAKVVSLIINVVIILSVVSYILSTEMSLRWQNHEILCYNALKLTSVR